MSKDEVLDALGSPNRTERIDGKEKWAYRFYSGQNHETEELRQVTFYNGRVVSVGTDTDEEARINELKKFDERRAENRKKAELVNKTLEAETGKAKRASGEKALENLHVKDVISDEEETPAKAADFKEMTGTNAPVEKPDENP